MVYIQISLINMTSYSHHHMKYFLFLEEQLYSKYFYVSRGFDGREFFILVNLAREFPSRRSTDYWSWVSIFAVSLSLCTLRVHSMLPSFQYASFMDKMNC